MNFNKYITFNILILVFFLFSNNSTSQQNFSFAEKIISKIEKTSFPKDTFLITDYGAKGDSLFNNNAAISNAIDACFTSGGGVVVISDGKFFCKGTISLKSNVNLHITEDAILLFSSEPDDYLPAVLTRWEGIVIYNYSPMIYTANQKNIAITGKGFIEGNALKKWISFKSLQSEAQNRARTYNDQQVILNKRVFGKGDYLRPSFIQFFNCKRILVEGVTLINSPMWMVHPVYSSDIIIRDVVFNSLFANNDGIDFDSSTTGLVEQCTFITGDDAVVFKSGRDRDGWRVNKPTKDIVVRNCKAPQVLHGIAFGSEMSGGIENIYIENIQLGNIKKEAIQFKSNKDRGGYIRDVFIRNIEVDSVGRNLLFFTNNYHSYRGGNSPSEFHQIYIEKISCKSAGTAIHLQGLKEMFLHDISIKKVTVNDVQNVFGRKEFYKDIMLQEFIVEGKKINL
ncbi:MAG: glycoside hydrolase family 28 protein [Prolixibacteraceae bacterium]